MKIALPDAVKDILECIGREGYDAYLVGGIVRDTILGITTTDIDIASNIPLEQLLPLIGQHHPIVFERYQVVQFAIGEFDLEIARFRRDSAYTGRHSEIEFVERIEDDLPRRDFTANAIAYSPETEQLVDSFGGVADVERHLVRAIADADRKFTEDIHRMMRGVSLALRRDFELADTTRDALLRHKNLLAGENPTLFRSEFEKMLQSDRWWHIPSFMDNLALWEIFFPRFSPPFIKPFCARDGLFTRLAVLLSVGDAEAGAAKLLVRRGFSKADAKRVSDILRCVELINKAESLSDDEILWLGESELLDDGIAAALCLGINTEHLIELFPGLGKSPLIGGDILKKRYGLTASKRMGELLRTVRLAQIRGKIETAEDAIDMLRELLL